MRIGLRFKIQFFVVLILASTIFGYISIASRFLEKDRLASLAEAATNQSQLMESRVSKKFVSLRFWVDLMMKENSSFSAKAVRENPHFLGFAIRENGKLSWRYPDRPLSLTLPEKMPEGSTFISFPDDRIFVLAGRSKEGIENFSFWSSELLEEEFTQTNAVFAIIPLSGESYISKNLAEDQKFLRDLQTYVGPNRIDSIEKSINGESYFLTLSSLESYPALVVWGYPKSLAMAPVQELRWMSLSFAVFALGATAFLSLWGAGLLTQKLQLLTEETARIAAGDLDATQVLASQDEVGDLSRSIVTMASSLKNLIHDVAEKSRMQAELNTAKVVQDTLIANESYLGGEYEIHGHLENASECGGDFWFHWQQDQFVFLIIGDATGHGASAALITSAVRATIASMKLMKEKNLDRIIEHLHTAIRETSKSQIMMTAFVGRLNVENGEVLYFNCSHEKPFIFGKDRQPAETLKGIKSPRLGDACAQRDDFKSSSLKIAPEEAIFFYTDGLIDGDDVGGVAFSARKLHEVLHREFQKPYQAQEIISKVFLRKRTKSPQADDMTAMILLRKSLKG